MTRKTRSFDERKIDKIFVKFCIDVPTQRKNKKTQVGDYILGLKKYF